MTSPIARPTFYEGEILPAADLGATVDYARNQMARHSRYQHTWGISNGLNLTFANGGAALGAGIAVDGTGREVVVPADIQLDPTTFDVFPQADTKTLYPVFLNGVDQPAPPSSGLNGACGGSQSTSMQENYAVTFGSPGSELQVGTQTAPAITDGPDGGISGAWLILLGFVTWDTTKTQFTGVADFNPTSNIGRQYVGVNASQVISNSGSLLLATHPPAAPGVNTVLGMELQEDPTGGQLIFGKIGTDGTITPALTIKANGDVTATGQFKSVVKPGSIQVQSGIAFDGIILPLPVGIDSTNVASGTVYTQVSVHYEGLSGPSAFAKPVPFPLRCTVDSATRQVNCRLRWWDAANWATPPVDLPAPCDYFVIVAVAAAS